MTSTQRLELRQGQSLAMTPQLLQSIKLLQYSHLELAAFVDAEFERNPLLQHAEDEADSLLEPKRRAAARSERLIRRVFAPGGALHGGAKPAPHGDLPFAGRAFAPDATLAEEIGLARHLESQLDPTTADPALREAARYLIHSLNEAGYLDEELDEMAKALGIGADCALNALRLVQSFDPPGIGARNLAECLTIQLRERGRLDKPMERLLTRLDLVARRDYGNLRKACGVTEDALRAMIAEIRTLDPKPGLSFGTPIVDLLVPDVFVTVTHDGRFEIDLTGMPRLFVDRSYHAGIVQSARNETDRLFLSQCAKNADWLAHTLDQRAATILKVTHEIVRRQAEFFHKGPDYLRPLTLRSIAEVVGLHESTISRATANKAIGSDRGTFPMRFFFSAALNGTEGMDAHSAAAVRHRIRTMVAAETGATILSDEAIAQTLQASGVEIARRTVAKYRETMRIPSSARRRRIGRRGPLAPQ